MKTKAIFLGLFIGLIFMIGCESEIDDKPAATVGEAQAEDESDDDSADDGVDRRELTMNVEASTIAWVGAKVTGDHDGGFHAWTGKAMEEGGTLKRLSFEVDTESIYSDNDDLTGHLMSDDFFDVKNYPEAAFTSTRIVEKAGDGSTHEVTGNFTIRGETKSVTFPAKIELDEDGLRATAEFTINRFDFGIEYEGRTDDLIRKEVLLKIDLTAS